MRIETLKSPNPRNLNSISVVKSKLLSVSLMNTLLSMLKVTDARRDVACVESVSVRFKSKERETRVKGCAKNVVSTRAGGGEGGREERKERLVLAAREMKRQTKNERGGRRRGRKETLADKPLHFENLR